MDNCIMCMGKYQEYIKIFNKPICRECEKKITELSIDDLEYEYYNIMIKKIWSNYLIGYNKSC